VQKEAMLAAKACIVTVEEVVDDLGVGPNACVIPGWAIAAIAVAEKGAHPSYAHGYYPRDNRFYKEWDAIARDREAFISWLDANVLSTEGAQQ
jgi:glutaconate CoA-transferase subunit A